jgi:hypothetical protein
MVFIRFTTFPLPLAVRKRDWHQGTPLALPFLKLFQPMPREAKEQTTKAHATRFLRGQTQAPVDRTVASPMPTARLTAPNRIAPNPTAWIAELLRLALYGSPNEPTKTYRLAALFVQVAWDYRTQRANH